MPKVDVLDLNGKKVDEIELSESVFGIEMSEHAVYEAIKNYLANQRQGTQCAKTRAEVRGGGRKPWKQKGTGRARQGSTRSPQWKGGGVVFAPKPRDYSYAIPKKVKRLAMKSVLTSKALENKLIVVDEFAMDAPKTKDFINVMSALNTGRKPLIITAENSPVVVKSGRNVPGVKISFVNMLNVYDVVNSDVLVITRKAIEKVEEVYA
ncbi:50S ribosomal protein L4 [Proteocatella sphenisci]|uniref:50S ribosomal protein L4 n=1 Tax=Proteocatella sphenisci TaxID=181070 RepID=UPI00048CC28D|nr:50S ribosomal protein L4 [Proteocatella sphenisci]